MPVSLSGFFQIDELPTESSWRSRRPNCAAVGIKAAISGSGQVSGIEIECDRGTGGLGGFKQAKHARSVPRIASGIGKPSNSGGRIDDVTTGTMRYYAYIGRYHQVWVTGPSDPSSRRGSSNPVGPENLYRRDACDCR